MSVVLVAGIWFVLGVVVCFVSGRGIADGQTVSRAPSATPTPVPTPVGPRRFAGLAVHEWARAADRLALDELLTAPSHLIGRVTAE